MAAIAEEARLPAGALHVVGANHQLVDVLNAEVDVVKAWLAGHAGKRAIGQEQIVVFVHTVGMAVIADAGLPVGEQEAKAALKKVPGFLIILNRIDHMVRGFRPRAPFPFPQLIEPVDVAGRIDGSGA